MDSQSRKAANACNKISDLLAEYANTLASQSALVFLETGDEQAFELSYSSLHRKAKAVAAELNHRGLCGERVLLLFPSGLDYVVSFLGCLYAGVIAVPVYPLRNNWHAERVGVIAQDARARGALTLSSLANDIQVCLAATGTNALELVIAADLINYQQAGFINESVVGESVAYLQYTSGSTGNPKGVMVRHCDLLTNCDLYGRGLDVRPGDTTVSWLPIFHDMGLVQGILLPLTLGGTAVFMPPTAFVQQPMRWLRAISRFRATFSGGPNFAYDLCISKISSEEVTTLDLGCWRTAVNGAEPISWGTMTGFAAKFAAAGLYPGALVGAFGQAESTLGITLGKGGDGAPVLWLDKAELERDTVKIGTTEEAGHRPFVSSGVVAGSFEVRIVNPASGTICAPGQIGEIWASGGSVCAGYWNKEQETCETFGAVLPEFPGKRYLRTGDLGFTHDGQLYVTGRLKDLIVIRGANHYPQDIERTAENAHPALRKGGWGAAFTLDDAAETPILVVVHEVERTARKKIDVQEVSLAIMQAVTEQHGIDVDIVVLVDPAGVPKTSSGKIQRKSCRQRFLQGELSEIGRWQRAVPAPAAASAAMPDRIALEGLLREWVARQGAFPVDRISLHQPFSALGLNSVKLVELIGELNDLLSTTLSPTVAFEYPTIERLAVHLAGGRSESTAGESECFEPVAIVGMACRFPGANSPEEFWSLLKSGESAVREIPADRVALTDYQAGGNAPYRWGGFLSDIELFDATLFGISPREAESVDPQQRLLLETAWHALESANIAPNRLAGSATGVFVGISVNDYFRLQREAGAGRDTYSGTGSALSIAANRISYCLGLQGPSMAVDTACSSSLVAVHQACRSLAAGETDLALAGGVNLVLSPDYGVIFSQARMLSPTGRCHTFSEAADGYVRGEGCGVIVLKLLRHAERDGDRILGVIRGSAVNQDGPRNGLTAPNGQAQQQVVRAALQRAGLVPDDIGYVETHGTGTPLGDLIEVSALKAVFGSGANAAGASCWLGAVKSNIGHLESAAGIAGLIKTVLVLQHGQIPPVCTDGGQNSRIDLSDSRVRIARELIDWPDSGSRPCRAGVSSFGFGGTNAHLVFERHRASAEKNASEEVPSAGGPLLLTLSANSPASLCGLAQQYARLVEAAPTADLKTLCAAANTRRARLPERLAVVGTDAMQIAATLARFTSQYDGSLPQVSAGRARQRNRIAFLFTGQGAQYAGMGRGLYEAEPVFRECLDRCDGILAPCLGRSILGILFGDDTALLDDTRYAQPALVALELALVQLWRQRGVEPEFVAGHSVGEYAAAHVAGLLNLDTCLRLVAERGRLMACAPGQGAMLSVAAGEDAVMRLLAEAAIPLEIAGVNAPDQLVLSGAVTDIDRAADVLAVHGVDAARLKVSHAFHSRLMEPVLGEFSNALAAVEFRPMILRMIPTGGEPDARLDQADYWIRQLRQPVRFAAAVRALVAAGADTFVEVGPQPVLSRLGQRTISDGTWIASMRKDSDDRLQWLQALGAAFVAGVEVLLDADGAAVSTVTLPSYVFDRQKYWFSRGESGVQSQGRAHSLAGRRLDIAVEDVVCFEAVLPGESAAYLEDHKLRGHAIMPGAGYASLMLTAAWEAGIFVSDETVSLRALEFYRPLDLRRGNQRVQTVIQRRSQEDADDALDAGWLVRVLAWDPEGETWETYASGKLYLGHRHAGAQATGNATVDGEQQDVAAFYSHWAQQGLQYGERFRAVRRLTLDGAKARAMLALPQAAAAGAADSVLHPALLDAAFQVAGALLGKRGEDKGLAPLPVGIDEILVHGPAEGEIHVEAQLGPALAEKRIVADLTLFDAQGTSIAQVRGLHLSMVPLDSILELPQLTVPQCLAREWIVSRFRAAGNTAGSSWIGLTESGFDTHVLPSQASRYGAFDRSFDKQQEAERSLRDAFASVAGAKGVIVCLAADSLEEDPTERCIALCRRLQGLLTALVRMPELPQSFKVCVLTRAAAIVDGGNVAGLGQAGLAAMLRSAALEYPGLILQQIDLPAQADAADLHALAAALTIDGESQLAIRNGLVMTPRLRLLQAGADAGTPVIRNDGSYLVTGGTGGIGTELADWLARAGAGQIVLASRRGTADERLAGLIEHWRARGVNILLRKADVGRDADVAALCTELAHATPPLRGVFHAAGVLRDSPLAGIGDSGWREVMNAKAKAALLLERHTRTIALDHFVLFSSIAASFGSAGQCNYAAANGVLDALAARRRQQGLCATTINWGPWAEIGMASNPALAQRLARQGLTPMVPVLAMKAFDDVLVNGWTQAIVAAVDWPRFVDALSVPVLPSILQGVAGDGAGEFGKGSDSLIPPKSLAAMDSAAAGLVIRQVLGSLLRQVLRGGDSGPLAPDADPCDVRLSSLGVDSLMAMELRNRVRAWVNVDLPAHLLIGNSSVEEVASLIYQKVLLGVLSQAVQDTDAAADDGEEFVL